MTEQDIANALRARLAGTTNAAPIVWENAPGVKVAGEWTTPEPPFWMVSQVKTPPDRVGLSTAHIARGRFIVAVLAKEGDEDGFSRTAEEQAEAIIARFPTNFDGFGIDGSLIIIARPYADEGYNDGAYWRVNVHIRWQAIL